MSEGFFRPCCVQRYSPRFLVHRGPGSGVQGAVSEGARTGYDDRGNGILDKNIAMNYLLAQFIGGLERGGGVGG